MSNKKKLVLVVHGIGEQKAGETINNLVGTISNNHAGRVTQDIKWLPDQHAHADPRKVEMFPCHTRRLSVTGSDILVAEVYWADLSRAVTGWIKTLIDLIKTVLGIGYAVRENALEKRPKDDWVRKLAFGFVEILHGPIMVSHLVNMMVILILFAGNWVADHGYLQTAAADSNHEPLFNATIATTALLFGLLFLSQSGKTRGVLFRIFVRWCGIFALYLPVLLLLRVGLDMPNISQIPCNTAAECDFAWYAVVLSGTQMLFWLMAIVFTFVVLIKQWLDDRSERRSMQALGTPGPNPADSTLYPTTAALMIILFQVITITMWVAAIGFMNTQPELSILNTERLVLAERMALSASTAAWISLALIVVAAGWVVFLRNFWLYSAHMRGKSSPGLHRLLSPFAKKFRSKSVPRMIIGPEMQMAIILGLLAWVAANIIMQLNFDSLVDANNVCTVADLSGLKFGEQFICIGTDLSLKIAGGLIALFTIFWSTLAVGLGVAKDIVGYFSREMPPEIGIQQSVKMAKPVKRNRINGRLKQVFEQLYAAEQPDEVIVIAHSQGTVVAMESIRDGLFSNLPESQQRNCHLVTMGSPIFHIYHHYFPNRFQILDPEVVVMGKWKNIYRIDDFVGTCVYHEDCDWPENRSVHAGGHTGYWMDPQVHDILYEDVLAELKSGGLA